MGFLQTVSRAWDASSEMSTRNTTLSNPAQWLVNAMGGEMSTAGIRVGSDSAMKYAALYACVKLISRTIASLDVQLILDQNGVTQPTKTHHLYPVLHDAPYKYYTAKIFWELIISQSLRFGIGYALIKRDQRGYVNGLCLIDFNDVYPLLTKGNQKPWETEYFRVSGYADAVHMSDMFILPNFEYKSPIALHRQAIGLGMAADEYGARFFGHGGNISGIIAPDGQKLSQPQADQMEAQFTKSKSGLANSHKIAVLPFNAKFTKITIPPNDSQFIETKVFQAQEICRIYGVPPFLIQADSDTKYNNTEQQSLRFVTDTIRPHTEIIEAEITTKLIPEDERTTVKPSFDMSSILRADQKSRAEFYNLLRRAGVLSINDILKKENMNTVEGGDLRFVQSNEIPLNKAEAFADALIKKGEPQKEKTNE